MGTVFGAQKTSTGEKVALKVLLAGSGDSELATRFEREAKAMAALRHPNIVEIFEFGSAPLGGGRSLYFLAMELVQGKSLAATLASGPVEPDLAAKVVAAVCEALRYAHERGVVHRDIKPSNILLSEDGRVKITDFGLAKICSQDIDDMTLTSTHVAMGTPLYMAPEQFEPEVELDGRADVYSLGVVLYQMLTGSMPQGSWEAPSRHRDGLDERWDEVVTRAVRPEPERRFPDAASLAADVDRLARGDTPSRVRRRIMIGGIVLVASGAAGAVLSRYGAKPQRNMPEDPVRRFVGHTDTVMCVAFVPGSATEAVSAGWDGRLIWWDLINGTPLGTLEMNRRLCDFALTRDREAIVCKIGGNVSRCAAWRRAIARLRVRSGRRSCSS